MATADGDAADSFLLDALEEPEPSSLDISARLRLRPGDVLGDRFVIEEWAGRGGMATVYRANDRTSGARVAVKVLARSRQVYAARFGREVTMLSELRHPVIVSYVGHGETAHGLPFLAMEWLDGEDLESRLSRSALTLAESIELVSRVCGGLALAHTRGIVHRDIKPSNLFLVGGEPSSVKLLDFGIARLAAGNHTVTRTGALLGTVGYMAPEQARGMLDLDARADVFALGCVLFECLTGRGAFRAAHAVAVLAKVLSDEPPRVSQLRPEVGPRLDALCASMLAKDRNERPSDARAVLEMLSALDGGRDSSAPPVPSLRPALTHGEQKIVSVILGRPRASSQRDSASGPSQTPTLDTSSVRLSARLGAELLTLSDGALLVVFSEREAATDQAAQAALGALLLKRERPDLDFSIATGRAETTGRMPVGLAIDRAADLLSGSAAPTESVALDELTAELLGSRFDVRSSASGPRLVGFRDELELPRHLMGKPTPCIGRDKELGLLTATLDECIQDSVARALVLTGPAGIGKSRLASEFLRRIRVREGVRVFVARADPMASGALSIVQKLIRSAAALRDAASAAEQRAALRAYLLELAPPDAEHVDVFLGELIAENDREPPRPLLRSARHDPAIMREQSRRAFHAWLAAETARKPVVIVLEDLHWGDAPSVQYLEEALRRLAERPLLVLALARAEVQHEFPRLWESAGASHVQLAGLSSRAAERLVRALLGEAVKDATVHTVVRLADGNAFYLEELVRRVSEQSSDLPETVLAMAQSRLERLEPEARRILRAASVFGETCWLSGTAHLLGDELDAAAWLEMLADREILCRARESRFAGDHEYTFRHALLRDAAYAMLTAHDRKLAHGLAGAWLEASGEREARTIADHFLLGGSADRALPWLVRAALAAMQSGDSAGATELSSRALALGANGAERGTLLVVKAYAAALATRTETAELPEALELLPRGSGFWWLAVSVLIWAAAASSQPETAAPYVQLVLTEAPGGSELSGPYGQAVQALVAGMTLLGQALAARSFIEQFDGATADDPDCDPVFLAWRNAARCQLAATSCAGGPWALEEAVLLGRQSAEAMAQAGSASGESAALMYLGIAALHSGAHGEAESAARRSNELAVQTGNLFISECDQALLAMVKTRRGHAEAALAAAAPLHGSSNANVVQVSWVAAAEAYAASERHEDAVSAARKAVSGPSPASARLASAVLARAYLALDRPREALAVVERAVSAQVPASPESEADLKLARACALRALGDLSGALSALAEARAFVLGNAREMNDLDLRRAYLENVPANIRVLELARAWLGRDAE